MIPVTAFAGKKVAVFGLGGSGLASASALLAGGADVIACDDDAQSVAKATAAGIPTADLRQADWSQDSRRWCWRPACRSPIRRRIGSSRSRSRPASR